MLDIYVAPTLEKIVDLNYGSSKHLAKKIRLDSYTNINNYVKSFRAHPSFKNKTMSERAHDM
jgi:hypothetical protein